MTEIIERVAMTKTYTQRDLNKARLALEKAKRIEMTIREQVDERENAPKRRALIGKHFRVRNNYSCPEKPSDYWWLWIRVIGVEGAEIKTVQVQRDKYGKVFVEAFGLVSFDGKISDRYLPVTRKQYNEAVRDILTGATELAGV